MSDAVRVESLHKTVDAVFGGPDHSPDIPHADLRRSVDALAPVEIDAITSALSDMRKWDRAAGAVAKLKAGTDKTKAEGDIKLAKKYAGMKNENKCAAYLNYAKKHVKM